MRSRADYSQQIDRKLLKNLAVRVGRVKPFLANRERETPLGFTEVQRGAYQVDESRLRVNWVWFASEGPRIREPNRLFLRIGFDGNDQAGQPRV